MQLTKGAIGNLINRYKAVLKKCHLLNVFGSLAVAGMLVMGGAGVAVAVDDLPLEGEHTYDSEKDPNVNHLMGGWLVKEDATTEATGDITLDVKGGTISEIIGGSYVKANSAFNGTLTHGTITTTIEGTTSSQFVVGGSKIANSEKANLKTGDISLTIKDGTFGQKDDGKPTDYELVMGGNYLKADLNANDTSKAEAGHITVNIDDGEFKTSVAGGSTAHVYNGNSGAAPKLDVTDASTSVTITGGTFDHSQSTGGGAINLDPSIIGGGLALVADGITAEGVSASSTITGNTLVTIAQAEGKELIINDKVLGGSLAQGAGAMVTVGTEGQNNTSGIVVKNVSKVGDLVGGSMAEGGMAILHGDSFVVVEAGKVEGDIMGGSYVRGAGTVTTTGNTGVVFNADNKATVNQAEYLVGGDKVLASSAAAQSTGTISGTSSVTVNGNASVTTGAVVGGSFSRVLAGTDNRAASATVENSVVTINGGKSIAGVVGGGLAEHLSGNGSATSTVTGTSAVYVNGGNLTNIVYTTETGQKASSYAAVAGAGLATGKNATASVGNSVVVIDGAETVIKGNQPATDKKDYFDKDNAKVVAGGVAVNGGTVKVTNTSLTMNNGKVTGDLVGGNLIDGTGAAEKITSTSVTLNDGTLNGEVMGGSYVRGSNTSSIDTTNVLVSGGELQSVNNKAQYVLGGGKALGYKDQQANLTIGTTNVTISDAVKVLGGGVIGGSLAKGTDNGTATVSVTKANTTILGGTQIAGVVGGGVAENYNTATGEVSSSVTESQLTIRGGTIDALRYGAQISDDGETASKAAVVGGGVASAKGTSGKVMSSVTAANTTINGGTINGNVFAGGLADGTSATANVTNANLTISGNAVITGNIHAGGYALNGGTATVTDTATVTFDGNSSFAGKVFGQGHTEKSGTATVNESTLAFTNYNGVFNGQVVGFTNLDVAEGSTLQLGALSTGEASEGDTPGVFNNNALTLTGAGNVVAANVDVAAGKGLSVEAGTLTVTESLKSAGAGNGTNGINVSGNGVLSVANNLLVKDAEGTITIVDGLNKLYLGNGGTLAVTGLDSISTTDMVSYHSALVVSGSTGLINYEGAAIEVSEDDKTESGNLQGSVAEKTGALLTGTTVEYDGASSTTTTTIKGNYGAETVLISNAANGEHTIKLNGNLTLLGDGEKLITVNEGATLSTVTVATNKALNLGSAAAPSQGGDLGADVELNDGSSLNAVAGDYTVGAVEGKADNQGSVSSSAGGSLVAESIGATHRVADVDASQGSIHSTGVIRTDELTIDGGMVSSDSSINVSGTVNMNGTLAAKSSIKLAKGASDAQGQIVTGGHLYLGNNITKAADGTLDIIVDKDIQASDKNIEATSLQARSMKAKDVSVEGGSLLLAETSTVESLDLVKTGISVADLTVTGNVTMTNGSAGMIDNLDAQGNVSIGEANSDGVSLVIKEMTTQAGTTMTFDPDWGYASNNYANEKLNYVATTDSNVVNNNLQVGRNSYVALGTADKSWLPSVVQGGLREDGVETVLGLAKTLVIHSTTITTSSGSSITGSLELNSDAGYDGTWTGVGNSATFGDSSLLVVDGNAIYGNKAAITFDPDVAVTTDSTLTVAEGAKLLVTDAVDGQTYTIVGNVDTVTGATSEGALPGWKGGSMTSTTDMISLGDAVFNSADKTVTTSTVRNDAHTVFPNLSDELADAVNDLYTGHDGAAGAPRWDYADVNSDDMGVRFLSRATDNRFLGADKDAAAVTIESAARIAFAGAVPQMTKMASDAGTNAVVNRLGFADPADGAQAMDAEGKIVDRNTTGFALWIAPLWQSQHGWGMEADNLDYGFNGNLGGVSLGADYTFENAIRAGITFNIGGGYAESSGGDLNSTENRMSFWGLGAYAGWNYENFGLMADVSYTSTWNDLKQDMDSRMGMGDLEADVQASAISAGLRAEYKLETSVMDVIPHIGVRYMSLNTWGFDAESNGGTVLEGDGFHQDIWTFPVGVTFTKDFTLDSGWSFKPSIDFSVIPAAGDIKAKQDVAFTGLPGSYEVETQMMDYLTWQGGVGLEMGNDTMSFGVNYTLQAEIGRASCRERV